MSSHSSSAFKSDPDVARVSAVIGDFLGTDVSALANRQRGAIRISSAQTLARGAAGWCEVPVSLQAHEESYDIPAVHLIPEIGRRFLGPGFYFTAGAASPDARGMSLSLENIKADDSLSAAQIDAFFDALQEPVLRSGFDAGLVQMSLRERAHAEPAAAFRVLLEAQERFFSTSDWLRGMRAMGLHGISREFEGVTHYVVLDAAHIRVTASLDAQQGDVQDSHSSYLYWAGTGLGDDSVAPALAGRALSRLGDAALTGQSESEFAAVERARARLTGPGASIHVDAKGLSWRHMERDRSGRWVLQGFDRSGLARRMVFEDRSSAEQDLLRTGHARRDDLALDRLWTLASFRRGLFAADVWERVGSGALSFEQGNRLIDDYDGLAATQLRVGSLVAQAFYGSRDDSIVLLADRIEPGCEVAVFLHEIVHKHGPSVIGDHGIARLVSQVKVWSASPRGSVERRIFNTASAKARAATGTAGAQHDEELLAYAVEEAVAAGVRPTLEGREGSAEQWLADVVATLQGVIFQVTQGTVPELDAQQLVDLAYALAQLESPERGPLIRKHLDATRSDGPPVKPVVAPQFFSRLGRAIENAPGNLDGAPASQWQRWISANGPQQGVKKGEIEWTGISDFLAMLGGAKTARSDLLGYLSGSSVQFKEVLSLSGDDDDGEAGALGVRYADRVVAGGMNYRELLITLSNGRSEADFKNGRFLGWLKERYGMSRDDFLRQFEGPAERQKQEYLTGGTLFKSNHWPDQSNVLVHVRLDDRVDVEGRRTLFVNEIQSDWGQQGREHGFAEKLQPLSLAEEREFTDLRFIPWAERTNAQHARIGELGGRVQRYETAGVKRGPFVGKTESWVALAIKRITMLAVEGGYDSVAFVSGEQAVEMFGLSKVVDRIEYEPIQDPADTFEVTAFGHDGKELFHEDEIGLDRIREVFGQELAQQMKQGGGASMADRPLREWRVIGAEGIKVGGDGLRTFYETIVPQVASDVLRRIGGGSLGVMEMPADQYADIRVSEYADGSASVEGGGADTQDFDSVDEALAYRAQLLAPTRQRAFRITPELRRQVLNGVPLFSLAGDSSSHAFAEWFGDSKAIDEDGKPLVMYHGTSEEVDFSEFRGAKFYFSPDPAYASGYADGGMIPGFPRNNSRVMPVFLAAQKPLDLRALGDGPVSGREMRSLLRANGIAGPLVDEIVSTGASPVWMRLHDRRLLDAVQRAGFDSIRQLEHNGVASGEAWVMFRPEQVKSAIGNDGRFDRLNPDIRFSFAGLQARTADTMALDEAKERLAAGECAEIVRQDTGWFLGADERWRFEIADDVATLLPSALWRAKVASDTLRLGGLLDHPKLFAAYPMLEQLPVTFGSIAGGAKASIAGGEIRFNEDVFNLEDLDNGWGVFARDQLLRSLMHELQHALQTAEGFATGGNWMEAFADPRMKPSATAAGLGAAQQLLSDRLAHIAAPLSAQQFAQQAWGSDVVTDEISASYSQYLKDARAAAARPASQRAAQDWAAKEWYRRLAGEVEARNVSLRIGLTADERRRVSPRHTSDVADRDVIIIFGGSEMAEAPTPVNTRRCWHGSPYRFSNFDLARVRSGEGALAFGWGIYVTDSRGIAENYTGMHSVGGAPVPTLFILNGRITERGTAEQKAADLIHGMGLKGARKLALEMLQEAQRGEPWTKEKGLDYYASVWRITNECQRKTDVQRSHGFLYQVDVPTQGLLLWDAPMCDQPPEVLAALQAQGFGRGNNPAGEWLCNMWSALAGGSFDDLASFAPGNPQEAMSRWLSSIGIRGVQYLESRSRRVSDSREPEFNYVIFKEEDVCIERAIEARPVREKYA